MAASLQSLSNEILLLIFEQLDSPAAFSLTSRQLHEFSEDAFARARWLMYTYGKRHAFFHALARSRLCDERLLDLLQQQGASLSRDLVQSAAAHYNQTSPKRNLPFANTHRRWCQGLRFSVFVHLLSMGVTKYGDSAGRKKHERDRAMWDNWFLMKARKGVGGTSMFNANVPSVPGAAAAKKTYEEVLWEKVSEAFEQHGFGTLCGKDPIHQDIMIGLALEPRLYPLAKNNGFALDPKFRDFIFRRVFQVPMNEETSTREKDIAQQVVELTRMDPNLFLSRTVAAEVCMDLLGDSTAFDALTRLDASGELTFELNDVAVVLISHFCNTAGVVDTKICLVLASIAEALFTDRSLSPFHDPRARAEVDARRTLLQCIFVRPVCGHSRRIPTIKCDLHDLFLDPLHRADIVDLLLCPFLEHYNDIIDYACTVMDWEDEDVEDVIREITPRLLRIPSKGYMLEQLSRGFDFVDDLLKAAIPDLVFDASMLDRICEDDLESASGISNVNCTTGAYHTAGQDGTLKYIPSGDFNRAFETYHNIHPTFILTKQKASEGEDSSNPAPADCSESNKGFIGTNTLRFSIGRDDNGRSPISGDQNWYSSLSDDEFRSKREPCPSYGAHVGEFVLHKYGRLHPMPAQFLAHAVLNNNYEMVEEYVKKGKIPVTMKHFETLAKVGRPAHPCMWVAIAKQRFYAHENDYVTTAYGTLPITTFFKPKPGTQMTAIPPAVPTFVRVSKRPRRSAAAAVKSYAILDEEVDQDEFMDEPIMRDAVVSDPDDSDYGEPTKRRKRRRKTQNVVKPDIDVKPKLEDDINQEEKHDNIEFLTWIERLTALMRVEQDKFREKKRRMKIEKPNVWCGKSYFMNDLEKHMRIANDCNYHSGTYTILVKELGNTFNYG